MIHRTGKKCTAVILALAIMLSLVFTTASATPVPPYANGDGTPAHPYEVSTQEQLDAVRDNLSSCFIQVADITIATADWIPIGSVSDPFTGSYDGGDFKISGLKINTTTSPDSTSMLGLFGVVGTSGIISNVNLENMDIDVAAGTGHYETFIGGLAGASLGTISGCSVTGTLNAAAYDIAAGGLVGSVGGSQYIGYDLGSVTECTSDCTLNVAVKYQTAHAGGLVGEVFTTGSSINNSSSSGTVTCRGDSDVNGTGPNAGGLIGYVDGGSGSGIEIVDCRSDAAVSAENARSQANAGGLIGGIAGNCTISDCTSTGNATASDAPGSTPSQICAGGLIGYSISTSVITNCNSSGNATATASGAAGLYVYSGGFLGYISAGTSTISITRCYSLGNATTTVNTNSTAIAGGFGGYFTNANVSKCYSKGDAQVVSAAGYASAGGFTGYYYGTGTMANSFSTGNATANCASNERAGGLSGVVQNSTVSHCYSAGIPTVSHDAYLPKCGGLVGVNNAGTVSGSYYDSTVSGKTDSDRGTPKSCIDMKIPDFVVSLAGADWKLVSNLNGGYPLVDGVGLGAQPTTLVTYKDSADTSTVYGTDTVAQDDVFSQPSWISPSKADSSLTGWYTDPSCESSYKWNFATQTVSSGALMLYAGWEVLPDTTDPTVSDKTITVESVSQTGVTLSWNKAADDTSTQSSLEYLVYISGRNNLDSVANIEAHGTAVGSYEVDISTSDISGLTPGTTYYFNVIVKDEAGNKTCYTTKSAATTPAFGTASYDTNLVINGNAEVSDTVMAGWTASGPLFMVLTPADSIPAPPSSNGGNVFDFFPPVVSSESIFQIIDISNLASDIDMGLVNIQAGAEARKYMARSNDTVRLELLSASGDVLDTYTASGTTEDANSTWENLTISRKAIDYGTRRLRLTLVAQISDAAPNSDYIEFDSVSLILSRTPVLTAGTVSRTSDTNATVTFSTDKAGEYYYGVVNDGDTAPVLNTAVPGIACSSGETSIVLGTLAAGAKDIYIQVKDAAGNVSTALKIDIPAYTVPDLTAPSLMVGSVRRASDSNATVSFTSDEAGEYYYGVVSDGDTAPVLNTGVPGIACSVGETSIVLGTLTAGAKDIYIQVKDAAGNVSTALKIDIPAYNAPDLTAPNLMAGSVSRTSDTNATVSFTSDETGEYYYGVVDDGAAAPILNTGVPGIACSVGETSIVLGTLTVGAKDIYIQVKDAACNVSTAIKINIPAYNAPDLTEPTLTAGSVNRLSITNATVSFTSDEAGEYYYSVAEDGAAEPVIDTGAAGVSCTSGETVISITTLTAGTKDIYVKVKDAAGNVSNALQLDIPDAFVPVTGIEGVPASAAAGVDLTLAGTVIPAEATNQAIVWSMENAGTTGVVLAGDTLSTLSEGTVTVKATVEHGASPTADYTQTFNIPVYVMSHNTLEEQVENTTVIAEGLIADSAQLIVLPIADGDADLAELEEQLTEQSAIAAYEVHMVPAEAFRPPLTLTFQVGEQYNGRTVYILHQLADGSTDVYTPTVSNGLAVISVNELSPFLLAVNPQVTIIQQPQSVLALVNQTATFHVEAEGLDPLAYQWQRRTGDGAAWEDISGATGADYTTAKVNKSHNGYQYRVIVSDVLENNAISDTAILTVTVTPATGDDSHPLVFTVMAVLFAAAVIFLLRKRRIA